MSDLRLYEVSVTGYGTEHLYARTNGAAKASAYHHDAFSHLTFGEFLKLGVRARLCRQTPNANCYDWTHREYGVRLHVGQRVTMQNEGPSVEGKGATVLYPGPGQQYVRVLIDGRDDWCLVHPFSVVPNAAPEAEAA
jgi:hypothetical protein